MRIKLLVLIAFGIGLFIGISDLHPFNIPSAFANAKTEMISIIQRGDGFSVPTFYKIEDQVHNNTCYVSAVGSGGSVATGISTSIACIKD